MERFLYGNPESNTVLIQMVDDHDLEVIENEYRYIRELTDEADFLLAAIKVGRWNDDLSPWPAPPVFGKDAFGEGAKETLAYILDEVIPALPGAERAEERIYYIGGYSLAGFFALWAGFQTDRFRGVAAASPSVWFPGFRDYVKDQTLKAEAVYLSLGDKEEKTRNAVMAQVGDAIREIHEHFRGEAVPCVLEWNPGNHFREPDLRTARGFAWLINRGLKDG